MRTFDEVVIATGVIPREVNFKILDNSRVASYLDILNGKIIAGKNVAVLGAGGIGFDVATFLVNDKKSSTLHIPDWLKEWGVTDPETVRGGILPEGPVPIKSSRQVSLFQRKREKIGRNLGKTTGWIHRESLRKKNVKMLSGINYEKIGSDGLTISYGKERKDFATLWFDTLVICAGQEPERSLYDALQAENINSHIIGGACVSSELDAKRAIDEGTRLALSF